MYEAELYQYFIHSLDHAAAQTPPSATFEATPAFAEAKTGATPNVSCNALLGGHGRTNTVLNMSNIQSLLHVNACHLKAEFPVQSKGCHVESKNMEANAFNTSPRIGTSSAKLTSNQDIDA
jgi:hypothetical protein